MLPVQQSVEKRTKAEGEIGYCTISTKLLAMSTTTGTKQVKHMGGCHCGAIRYEVMTPPTLQIIDCNCSICTKKQNRHFLVPSSRFKLLKGHDSLTTYTFNTHGAKHNFCKFCGVQSFFIPRMNPDGIGVMPHCLDNVTTQKVIVEPFDGKNWEVSIKKHPSLKERSKEVTIDNRVDVMY